MLTWTLEAGVFEQDLLVDPVQGWPPVFHNQGRCDLVVKYMGKTTNGCSLKEDWTIIYQAYSSALDKNNN